MSLPDTITQVRKLASIVGGSDGRMMAEAVEAALEPDLGRRTTTGAAVDGLLSVIGGYDPSPVPLKVKKMMRTDGQLRFGLAAIKAPILAAPFHFETRSRELAALLTDVFIKSGFVTELLRTSLLGVDYGCSPHEALWDLKEDVTTQWDAPTAEGAQKVEEKNYPQLFVPQRFKDLDPEKVTILKDDYGRFQGMLFGVPPSPFPMSKEQIAELVASKKVNVLDPEKSFLFTPIFEHQNFRGESRLDWAYDPWYWSKITYMIALRWYERKADPPYVIYCPTVSMLPDPDLEEDVDNEYDPNGARKDSLKLGARILQQLRSGGGAALPSEPYMDDTGKPSNVRCWEIKEVVTEDMHPAFVDFIDHLDKKKVRSLWVSDAVLSRDRQVGTLGSVEAAVGITIETQNETLRAFVRHFNEFVLTRFLRYNGIKDKAYLSTTGVLKDNRQTLHEFLLKLMEADMLAEQAWGRVFAGSLTQMVDREGIVRELGIPFHKPDPNDPLPKPPPTPEPTEEAKAGKNKVSNGKAGGTAAKRDTGLALDSADPDFTRFAQEQAREFEEGVVTRASESKFRDALETHEKAAIAIMLWFLLRSDKRDEAGKRIAGDAGFDNLIWDGRTVKSPAALAEGLPALTKAIGEYEGRGITLDPTATAKTLPKARAALRSSLSGLTEDIQAAQSIESYIESAVQQGQAATRAIIERFEPDRGFAPLTDEEAKRVVRDNVTGLLLNVENIVLRNIQQLTERALMAVGRKLGLVDDVANFRFNSLYSDLTLEAHLRAAFRRAAVESGLKSGLRFYIKVPTVLGDAPAQYDFVVGTTDWWNLVGESQGAPNPSTTFGLHHGSKSYWLPVPLTVRLRGPATA